MMLLYSIRWLLLSALLLNLVGCGNMTSYQPDLNTPHAKLGFQANNLFSNENIGVIFKDYRTCKQGYNIPMFRAPMEINADIPTTIFVKHIIGYENIHFVFTFIPKANHTYLINTATNHSRKSLEISLILYNKSDLQNDTWQKTPLIERNFHVGFIAASCTDINIDLQIEKSATALKRRAY